MDRKMKIQVFCDRPLLSQEVGIFKFWVSISAERYLSPEPVDNYLVCFEGKVASFLKEWVCERYQSWGTRDNFAYLNALLTLHSF